MAHRTLLFRKPAETGAPPGAASAVLTVMDPDGGKRVLPINRNPTILGRSNNADVVLADEAVADFHARIIKHNFGYTVEDLGSAGGTYRRDRRISHARLVHGDMIRLGRTVLVFADEGAAGVRSPEQTALVPANATLKGLSSRPPDRLILPVPYRGLRPVVMPSATPLGRRGLPGDDEDSAPSLDELILKVIHAGQYLRRRLWLILGLVLGAGALGAASFVLLPPVRAAYSQVILRPAPRSNPIETEVRQPPAETMQFFEGAERAFLSRDRVLSTLRKMGAANASEPWADAIAKRMRFETLGNYAYNATLTPSLFSKRNDWHVRFLDTHLRNYIDSEIEQKMKGYVAEVDFLRGQSKSAEQQLRDIAQQTVQFREANSDQLLAQSALGPGTQAELESKRIEISGRIDRLSGEYEAARSQLARGSALSHAKSQSSQSDREALSAVNRKLTELRAQGLADGHPDVQRLLNEQKNLQRMIEEHVRSDPSQFEKNANVAYDSLRSQLDQLGAQLRAARSERATIESSLRALRTTSSRSPEVNARIEELGRMKQEAEKQHALLVDRLKKAEIQLELERVSTTSRYEIVIPARLEAPPGRKAFVLRTVMGLFLGTLLAVAIVGLNELRRRFARIAQNDLATAIVDWSPAPRGRTGRNAPER